MALSKQTVRMFPSPHLTLPHPAPLSLPGWWEASTIIVVAPELRCALHNKDQISITLPNILDIILLPIRSTPNHSASKTLILKMCHNVGHIYFFDLYQVAHLFLFADHRRSIPPSLRTLHGHVYSSPGLPPTKLPFQ